MAKLLDIANKLSIKGEVKNLKDGSVRVIAQSENEDKLKEFAEKIHIKNTLINVSDISFEYVDIDKIYTDFKKIVKPGEVGERMDSAVEELKKLIIVTEKGNDRLTKEIRTGNDRLSGKLGNIHNSLNEKLGVIHEDLSVNLKSFHQDTIARFDIVDEKYGKIAENIEKAVCAINRTCDNTEKILEKSEKDRQDYKDSMKDLVGAIVKLAGKK